jgi:type IV pilus assembly protein PilP
MKVRFQVLGAAIAVCILAGCGEEVKLGPTTAEFNSERQTLAAKLEKGKGKGAALKRAAQAPSGSGFAAADAEFVYDPAGRRDPFRSFEWDHLKREFADSEQSGPLEQYDLAQLALIGVVWDVGRARALVRDPSGMSYVVATGARMGKNAGHVTQIEDNLLIVRERYVDLYGNESSQDVELRIRASEGG